MNIIEKYRYRKKMEKDESCYCDELIEDLKKRLHDEKLECFRFSSYSQIQKLILNYYKNVNYKTIDLAICKITIMHFFDDFRRHREFEEKIDFEEILRKKKQ